MSRKLLHIAASTLFIFALYFTRAAQAQNTQPFPPYHADAEYNNISVQSLYVTMRDGVKIAIDVVIPKPLPTGTRIPAILDMTRYWRAEARAAGGSSTSKFFATHGYAFIMVDVRGSGASSGAWRGPQSPDEIRDEGELVNWIVSQSWSNGKVGALGVSYEGSTAQMLAVPNHPAVKAVIPEFHEYDLYTDIAFPGGIFAEEIVRDWNAFNQQLDRGEGVKPVDADTRGLELREAVREHSLNVDVYKAALGVTYRDDSPNGLGSIDNLSVFRYRREIERSGVAIYGWGSWMDAATADTCIRRFVNFSNPQSEIIGAWSHGAGYDADPFHAADTPVAPTKLAQLMEQLRFFDYYLKGAETGARAQHTLTYYTMGEGLWKTTKVWPVAGTKIERWYFGENGSLSRTSPRTTSGEDRYTVDFTATTGKMNRWFTENGGGDVVYNDRASEDRKLLTYTSAPLMEDMEVTGYPIVNLNVSSTMTDGAFFVYLEDVDEQGRVTYITEGELRALHRKISHEAQPNKMFVPFHSFRRSDRQFLVPGQVATLNFGLFPTSVLIKKGHRIRISIAGSDQPTFARIPADGTPIISVIRSVRHASFIDLPVVPRN